MAEMNQIFFVFFERYNQKAKKKKKDYTCSSCLIKSMRKSFCSRCKRKKQTHL